MKANLDFETASTIDLTKVGAHIYAAHPTTRILCMHYKVNHGPVQRWKPGQPFPEDLAHVIKSGGELEAWNAQFERLIWPLMVAHHGAPAVNLEQWRCTMVRAFLQGFPGALAAAGPAMGLGVCKDDAGHKVMLQLCKPRQRWAPGKKGHEAAMALVDGYEYEQLQSGEVVRWWQDQDKYERLYDYCDLDVETEAAASAVLDPFPPGELRAWQMDQRINDRGFFIDTHLVSSALTMVKPATQRANEKLSELTNGELTSITKPNDLRAWLNNKLGIALDGVGKDILSDLLVTMRDDMPDNVVKVIELRLAAAKTSTAKLNAMLAGMGPDHRLRGGLQFAGAARTGRYAGRRVQIQNFPRPEKWALEAVEWILAGEVEDVELGFGNALDAISSALRSCITARPGNELMFADYNAIEARMVAWLCNATELLNAYHNGEDPYRIMAAKVFQIEDWRSIGKDSFERFLGKQLILGSGYGQGDVKFQASCKKLGHYIDLDLAKRGVDTYRQDYHEIPAGWKNLERAAQAAMQNPLSWVPSLDGKIHFYFDRKFMRVRLPSGRFLSYAHPRLVEDVTPWGSPTLRFQFWGWDGERQRMVWQTMYGGKWLENISQAVSRDVMIEAMLRLEDNGWPIILTIHDEIGAEPVKGERDLNDFISTMAEPVEWAPGLPLAVEGWVGHRFRK